jgi:hypothetical protein
METRGGKHVKRVVITPESNGHWRMLVESDQSDRAEEIVDLPVFKMTYWLSLLLGD